MSTDFQPSAPTSSALKRPKPTVAVGLDFGTHGTGFAYCLLREAPASSSVCFNNKNNNVNNSSSSNSGRDGATDPRVMLHASWPDRPEGTADPKTRTAVLYRGRHLEAWGWSAWRRWSLLSESERQCGEHCYLEGFKLLLAGGEGAGGAVGGTGGAGGGMLSGVLQLPVGLTAVQVVADFLGEVRRYIIAHLRRTIGGCTPPTEPSTSTSISCGSFHPDRIAWCLTLPAMWGEGAKARMRQAAQRAGLIRTAACTSLMLTLEPEAAALAAAATVTTTLHTPPPDATTAAAADAAATAPTLQTGDVLLVLDCGGGTADITIHRVVAAKAATGGAARGPGAGPAVGSLSAAAAAVDVTTATVAAGGAAVRLREAAAGEGALAGGRFVDEALWGCVRQAVGSDPWDTWVSQHPAEWTHLRDEWEGAKRFYTGVPPPPLQPPNNLIRRAITATATAAPAGPMGYAVAAEAADASRFATGNGYGSHGGAGSAVPGTATAAGQQWKEYLYCWEDQEEDEEEAQVAEQQAPDEDEEEGEGERKAAGRLSGHSELFVWGLQKVVLDDLEEEDAGGRNEKVQVWSDYGSYMEQSVRQEGEYDIVLRLPLSLIQALSAADQCVGAGLGRCHAHSGNNGATSGTPGARPWLLSTGLAPQLVVPGEVLEREVFGLVVDGVVDLALRVAAEGARNGTSATKVLLAGGFACSPYLQRRVLREVAGALGPPGGAPLPLLLPENAAAAVVTGAVLYGHDPTRVAARICRLSYGLAATAPWSPVHEAHRALRGYPEREENPDDGTSFADGIFVPFVIRGQQVESDEVVTHFGAPLHRCQDSIDFDLYGTDAREASYIGEPGMRRLGHASLQLPDGWRECPEVVRGGIGDYLVQVDLRFGATEITLSGRSLVTQQTVATSIQWSADSAAAHW